MILTSYTFREWRRRPGRTVLTLLGIVIGVQALVAIPLAIQTTRYTHRALFEGMTGRASLEVVPYGQGGFTPGLAVDLEGLRDVRAAVPVIQSTAALWGSAGLVPLMTLGIDPGRDEAARDFVLREGSLLSGDGQVMLESGLAKSLGIPVGELVRILAPSGTTTLQVVGLLEPRGAAMVNAGAVAFVSLATSQRLYSLEGKVNALHLVLAEGVEPDRVADEVSQLLPPGLAVQEPAARATLAGETLANMERMLATLSVGSLVAGAFVILNSFLMNLGERRHTLAILRSLGATRAQVTRLLLSEAVALSVIGTSIGIPLGLGTAFAMTRLMAQFTGPVAARLQVTPGPLLLAGLLGPGVAMLATYFPSRSAARRSPIAQLCDRPAVESGHRTRLRRWPGRVGLAALAAFALAYAIILAGWLPTGVFIYVLPVGMVLTLVGCGLSIPIALDPLSRAAETLLRPLLGIEAGLAIRQLRRHPTRTSLVVGVLLISVVLSTGFGNAILNSVRDARSNIVRIFANVDFLVIPTGLTGTELLPVAMPESYADSVGELEGVQRVGKGHVLASRAAGFPVVVFSRTCGPDEDPGFRLLGGVESEIRSGLQRGEVVVGSALAQRAGVERGDRIRIETREGVREFAIAGMATDYTAGGMLVLIEWGYAKRFFGLEGMRYLYVVAEPGASGSLESRLRAFCDEHQLLLHSASGFRATCDEMIAGAVASAWVLLALVFVVASLGVTNCLTMNVLEQTRELGVLRAVAMKRWQICKMILAQGLAIGVISILPGMLLGALLGYVVNSATFAIVGMRIPYVLESELLIGGVVVALLVSGLASLPPARRAGQLTIIHALKYE